MVFYIYLELKQLIIMEKSVSIEAVNDRIKNGFLKSS